MAYITVEQQAAFDAAEQRERDLMTQLFNKNGITDFFFTPIGSKEQYDGEYTNKAGKRIIFEVKNRDLKSNKYDTTVIEQHKLDYLLKKGKEEYKTVYCFFFFTDEVVYIHQLKQKTDYNIQPTPSTTSTYGAKIEAIRQFVYLPINRNNIMKYN